MIEQLYLFATIFLGLFAGSLLTEATILVPYWRRMRPNDFLTLHGALGPYLFRYFAPLTVGTTGLVIVRALLTGADNIAWMISAGLCLMTLAIFFIYFRAANNRFASHNIGVDELGSELQKWSQWHWFRTVLSIVALATSVYGHTVNGIS